MTRTDRAAGTGATDPVTAALTDFDPVRDERLRQVLRFFWVAQGVLLLVDVALFHAVGVRSTARLILVLSPHVFAAWAALLAYRCLQRVQDTLQRLWNRNVFTTAGRDVASAERRDVAVEYAEFVRRLDRRLNGGRRHQSGAGAGNRFQDASDAAARVAFALSFAWLLYWFYPVAGFPWGFPIRLAVPGFLVRLGLTVDIGLQMALAVVLGLFAWRLVVVALGVADLSRRFDFKLHVQDPDTSAGLKPAGDLCFSIAAIWAVVAIYPTAWLTWLLVQLSFKPDAAHPLDTFHSLLCPVQTGEACFHFLSSFTLYFGVLLLLTFALAAGTFLLPLYSVHGGMERARPAVHARLDALARHIDDLAAQAAGGTETLSADDLAALNTKLTAARQVYDANAKVPTWPFDVRIFGKFVGATIVPLSGVTVWLPALVGKLVGA